MSDSKIVKYVEVRCDFFMANLDIKISGRTNSNLVKLEDAKIQAFKSGVIDFEDGIDQVPSIFSGLAALENEWLTGFNSAQKLSEALELDKIPEEFSLEDIIKSLS